MFSIGRICIKLSGRDAGKEAVIVDVLEGKYVLIDGNVRRRKCNIVHLEPTSKKIDIKKGATHDTVKKEFEKLKLKTWETNPRKAEERPKKQRKKKEVAVDEDKKKTLKQKETKTVKKEEKEEKTVEKKSKTEKAEKEKSKDEKKA
jgi:large subunit ribosomal protein L14e